jgi:molybdopterin-containing oxidoreductase family iron-sulfur binding subunit
MTINSNTAENQDNKPRWAMVIDLAKCIGCHSCTVACMTENSQKFGSYDASWSPVYEFPQEGEYPHVKEFYLPRPCMHCQDAPCVKVCPTQASHYHDDGTVQIDQSICIGCRYCIVSCPYEARHFNWIDNPTQQYSNPDSLPRERGVVEKCTFCIHRREKGVNIPACIEVCVGGARSFGDLNDKNSFVSKKLRRRTDSFKLKPELGTHPSVWYLPASNPKAMED